MLARSILSAALFISLMSLQAGCQERGSATLKAPLTVQQVVNDLTLPDPASRLKGVESLQKLSPEDQQKVISTLEDMLKTESHPNAKADIQKGLEAAKEAQGG